MSLTTPSDTPNSSSPTFTIQFWGVRGQIATPGENTLRYGGNTPCLEMKTAGERLIFDGGTGLRPLGNQLLREMPVLAHLFFTHCHWDRIQGFPFFVPAFIKGNHFLIYGAEASNGASFKQRLQNQMLGPNFPVPMQVMGSELEFKDLEIGTPQAITDNIIVETCLLNYEHRSIGYRVNSQGKSVVYATDTDGNPEYLKDNFLELSKNADLLIFDAPDLIEKDPKDSLELREMWFNCIEQANLSQSKKIIMSTHNPDHDDQFLDQLEVDIQKTFPHFSFAHEGMTITL